MSEGPRRFIAGAVCPRCGAQDRIRVFTVSGRTLRECVACDFADELVEAGGEAVPKGRLDGPRRPASDGARPLQFHPPKRKPPPQS